MSPNKVLSSQGQVNVHRFWTWTDIKIGLAPTHHQKTFINRNKCCNEYFGTNTNTEYWGQAKDGNFHLFLMAFLIARFYFAPISNFVNPKQSLT